MDDSSAARASTDDVAARVAATVRGEIRALSAYPVTKAEGMIKLDAMENPYALPADVRLRLANALAKVDINRYPDGGAEAVKRALHAWLAYPNNPTGNLFDAAAVERIIGATPGLVVVDEAYYAFADRSFIARVLEYPNLVVVRTVSKIGMAGLRLGYAVAHPAWIAELE